MEIAIKKKDDYLNNRVRPWEEIPVVILIPDEIRKKYVEHRHRDANELAAALEKGEFAPFSRIGHQLRGNAPTYGYDGLVGLGRRMEEAANRRDPQEATDCFFALKAWVEEQMAQGEDG